MRRKQCTRSLMEAMKENRKEEIKRLSKISLIASGVGLFVLYGITTLYMIEQGELIGYIMLVPLIPALVGGLLWPAEDEE